MFKINIIYKYIYYNPLIILILYMKNKTKMIYNKLKFLLIFKEINKQLENCIFFKPLYVL